VGEKERLGSGLSCCRVTAVAGDVAIVVAVGGGDDGGGGGTAAVVAAPVSLASLHESLT
jgi:hypothetical protein